MAAQTAYGGKTNDASFRKTWDTEEYAKKAQQKDVEAREYAQKADEARKKGKKPPRRKKPEDDLPKPTKKMQAREGSLELDKNVGKTMVVAGGVQRGPGAPGYYCDLCERTLKDSVAYLDHLNSRQHLRKIGQNTKIHRSTLDQVRARIAQLREETKEKANAKAYDFEQRLKELKDAEKTDKQAKKEKQRAKLAEMQVDEPAQTAEEQEMAAMMGFSGFGGTGAKR